MLIGPTGLAASARPTASWRIDDRQLTSDARNEYDIAIGHGALVRLDERARPDHPARHEQRSNTHKLRVGNDSVVTLKQLKLISGGLDRLGGLPKQSSGRDMTRRAAAAGLLAAWLILVGLVGVLAWQIEQDIRQTGTRVCGAWLGTYDMLAGWGQRADLVTPEESAAAADRFRAEFDAHCADYRQAIP